MSEKPDFVALKAKRDAALQEILEGVAKKWGADPKTLTMHVCPDGCYCACPDGPCEHEFSGWREFDEGNGGETFCQKCGLGCMAHDMRVAP